jgi:hypothetical protein
MTYAAKTFRFRLLPCGFADPITNVIDLESAGSYPKGIYAIGTNADGEVSFEWVSR